jgi:CRP-like cAMP-binding protein
VSERIGGHRLELNIFVRSLFGDVDGSIADEMAARMREIDFERGHLIYRRGEASTYLYFIVEGQVSLEAPGVAPWKMGPSDGFGFQDAMQDRPHARDARADTDTRVLVFSVEDWLDIIEDHGELGRAALLRHGESVRRMVAGLAPDGGFRAAPADVAPATSHLSDLVERMLTLSEIPVFERAGIQSLATMARVARPVRSVAGEVILAEDKPVNRVYVVSSGLVEMERTAPALSARFGPSTLVGGLSMFGLEKADFTIRAVSDSVVFHISQDDWLEIMDDHFDLARSVFLHMGTERQLFMGQLADRKAAEEAA